MSRTLVLHYGRAVHRLQVDPAGFSNPLLLRSMPPWVIACSSRRGAPTVFKSVLPVLDATLDQPGTAMQTRHRPGARGVHGVDLRKCNALWADVQH
jgi:hypothetical protein